MTGIDDFLRGIFLRARRSSRCHDGANADQPRRYQPHAPVT
jgi:hypothetical protein